MKIIVFLCFSFCFYLVSRFDLIKINFTPPQANADNLENKLKNNEPNLDDKTKIFDPLAMHSEVEIKLLETLAQRRNVLEKQEKDFQKRLLTLKIFEDEIKKKLEQLKLAKESIKKDLNIIDKKDAERLENFAQICQKMKPKNAAKIFEQLEPNELMMIINCMKAKSVSDIIGKMNPEKAKLIVKQMVAKTSTFSN